MYPTWTEQDRQWYDEEWLAQFPLLSEWDALAEILHIQRQYPLESDNDNARLVKPGETLQEALWGARMRIWWVTRSEKWGKPNFASPTGVRPWHVPPTATMRLWIARFPGVDATVAPPVDALDVEDLPF